MLATVNVARSREGAPMILQHLKAAPQGKSKAEGCTAKADAMQEDSER